MKLLCILFISVFSINAEMISSKDNNKDRESQSIEHLVKSFSTFVSKNLPIQIDSATILVSMIPLNKSILITKSIDTNNKQLVNIDFSPMGDMHKYMYEKDRKQSCYNKDTLYLITRGAKLMYYYEDINKKPLFKHIVQLEDCNLLNK